MSEHTLGPWTARFKGDAAWSIDAADGWMVAEVAGRNQEEDEANALVMAAAPDLLEACNAGGQVIELLYAEIIAHAPQNVKERAMDLVREWRATERAAIRKATGGD